MTSSAGFIKSFALKIPRLCGYAEELKEELREKEEKFAGLAMELRGKKEAERQDLEALQEEATQLRELGKGLPEVGGCTSCEHKLTHSLKGAWWLQPPPPPPAPAPFPSPSPSPSSSPSSFSSSLHP